MKCSIVYRPQFMNSNETLLQLANINVFTTNEFGGQTVIPVSVKSFKRGGTFSEPFVDVRNPQYQDEQGKWRTSYLSVHLDGDGIRSLKEKFSNEFIREACSLLKEKKGTAARDYEYRDGSWQFIEEREIIGQASKPESQDLFNDAVAAAVASHAKKLAEKANKETQSKNEKVESSDSAKEALGM